MADGFRWDLTWFWIYPDPAGKHPGIHVIFRRSLTLPCPPQAGWMLDGLTGCDEDEDTVAKIEDVTLHCADGHFDVFCEATDWRDIPGADMEADIRQMTAAGWAVETANRIELPVSP